MVDTATLEFIKAKIHLVEASGFGDVAVFVKNGVVYRVRTTADEIVENRDLTTGQTKK